MLKDVLLILVSLNNTQKQLFYTTLIHDCTLITRSLITSTYDEEEKLRLIRIMNEIIHIISVRMESVVQNAAKEDENTIAIIEELLSRSEVISNLFTHFASYKHN